MLRSFMTLLLLAALPLSAQGMPEKAETAARHAVERYDEAQLDVLADLVEFRTFHVDGIDNWKNPEFRGFADYVRARAEEYGLDFTDMGAVLIVGLGDAEQRLGIVTHGDVQPADPSKWTKSPFELDAETEPGRLIARGTEDNKAPIATALQAMRTIGELGIPLQRRIELIISLTEESDWEPFRAVLEYWQPPAMNIAIDSEYPVVVAEKGWGGLWLEFSGPETDDNSLPRIASINGGAFISQVPEDARIVISNADDALASRLHERIAARNDDVNYSLQRTDEALVLTATGKAAHSSTPEEGINAITHAAALLNGESFADTAAGRVVSFINTLLGTGLYGEKFGNAAWSHPFMGRLTVNTSTVETVEEKVKVGINTRAPAGRSAAELEREMRSAIDAWAEAQGVAVPSVTDVSMSDAYYPQRPQQVEPLLAVFRHYTGQEDAEPISIGGGTNARLLPGGVNFGPSMPNAAYTGHSEHEFITREQMTLNLRMYTAMMAWLAVGE